jgi:hypothetical protein
MSLVLTGPRRIYVLVLFRGRAGAAGAAVPSLRRLEGALGGGPPASGRCAPPEGPRGRLVASARIHRRWRRSVIGLSFFVLAME